MKDWLGPQEGRNKSWQFVCEWCKKEELRHGGKRTAKYCSNGCRKAAFDQRKRREFEARSYQGDLLSGIMPAVATGGQSRGGAGDVPAPSVPLDGLPAPICLKEESAPQGGALLPRGERPLFVPPASGEIGQLCKMGQWERVAGCWQKVLTFERGCLVLEAYDKPQGGWSGQVVWTSLCGVPFRYSHYIEGERYSDVTLELDMLQGEALARMELEAVGEGD